MAKYIDLNGLGEFWRKAKEYIDSHSGGGGNVFIAELGNTDFSEIKSAFNAGKAVFCFVDKYVDDQFSTPCDCNALLPCQYALDSFEGTESFSFVGFVGNLLVKYKIDEEGNWTGGYLNAISTGRSIAIRTFDDNDVDHHCALYLDQSATTSDVRAKISSTYNSDYAIGSAMMGAGSFTSANPDAISIGHDSTTYGTDDNINHRGNLKFGVRSTSSGAAAGYCDIDVYAQDNYSGNEAVSYIHAKANPFDSSGTFVEIGVKPDDVFDSEKRYVFENNSLYRVNVYDDSRSYAAFLSSDCPNPQSIRIWVGTQAQYSSILPDSNTVYIIK